MICCGTRVWRLRSEAGRRGLRGGQFGGSGRAGLAVDFGTADFFGAILRNEWDFEMS